MILFLRMDDNLYKIKQLLANTNLSQEDQRVLYVMFSAKDDTELESIVELFVEQPESVMLVNDNFKAKKAAVLAKDKGLWNKAVDDEVAILEQLTKSKKS